MESRGGHAGGDEFRWQVSTVDRRRGKVKRVACGIILREVRPEIGGLGIRGMLGAGKDRARSKPRYLGRRVDEVCVENKVVVLRVEPIAANESTQFGGGSNPLVTCSA